MLPDFSSIFGRRLRVAIGHPFLGRGGSEAGVMWLIQALKNDCAITVVTTGGWDLDELNRHYGTSVRPDDVRARIAPVPRLIRNMSASALRGSLYQRFARQIASEYDIRISAYNPTDWGLPAIHFIADFSWHREIREAYDPRTPGLIYGDTPLRRAYLALARAYASPSGRNCVTEDVLVANSRWSAGQLRRYYPLGDIPVVYPPVWTSFPGVPWHAKEEAFVMIGRIAPEKKVEAAIRVLAAVRSRGHERLRLHLCGGIPDDPYGRSISALCAAHREWVVPHGFVSGAAKAALLAQCRYGIQARPFEAFGISVAEMAKAGAIVFAPNGGGQAEILDHPGLLFSDERDAAEKIDAVLRNPDLQDRLRAHLANQARLFSAERFMQEARRIVVQALPPAALPSLA